MKSIRSIFRKSTLIIVGVTFFASVAIAAPKDNKETAEKMDVNVVAAAGASSFNLKVNQINSNDVYVTVYDSNNTKLFSEKLNSKRALKKRYKLSKYNSKSFFFVIESGDKVYTQEVI